MMRALLAVNLGMICWTVLFALYDLVRGRGEWALISTILALLAALNAVAIYRRIV